MLRLCVLPVLLLTMALDGRPYSDVDVHYDYWMDSIKRLAPWHSYIKREIAP